MKKFFFLTILLSAVTAFADDAKNEWHNTVLTEATMKKIQEAKYDYRKCVVEEMKKPEYQRLESRKATEGLIKQCEPVLARMRQVYTEENVPGVIADRHLKQTRIQTTRTVLQELMFAEAARKAGQQ
jgi:hypothetical protein